MPDREKVVKALEICAVGNKCDGCPLKSECNGTVNAAMVGALRVIKEQRERIERLLENLVSLVEEAGEVNDP